MTPTQPKSGELPPGARYMTDLADYLSLTPPGVRHRMRQLGIAPRWHTADDSVPRLWLTARDAARVIHYAGERPGPKPKPPPGDGSA